MKTLMWHYKIYLNCDISSDAIKSNELTNLIDFQSSLITMLITYILGTLPIYSCTTNGGPRDDYIILL